MVPRWLICNHYSTQCLSSWSIQRNEWTQCVIFSRQLQYIDIKLNFYIYYANRYGIALNKFVYKPNGVFLFDVLQMSKGNQMVLWWDPMIDFEEFWLAWIYSRVSQFNFQKNPDALNIFYIYYIYILYSEEDKENIYEKKREKNIILIRCREK